MAKDLDDAEKSRTAERRAKRICLYAGAIIGCCLVFVIAVRVLYMVGPAVELLLTGVILGFICSPITNFLARHKVPRALGAFIALLIVLAVLTAVVVLLGGEFLRQMMVLLQHVPTYFEQIRGVADDFWARYGSSQSKDVEAMMSQVMDALSAMGNKFASQEADKLSNVFLSNLTTMINNFVTFFLGLVLAYWFAKDYPRIVHELVVASGPKHETDTIMLLAILSRSMGGYMRGIVATSTVGGLLSFFGFSLIGHPYAALMGITVGIFHFVPVIGPWVAAFFSAGLALFVSPWLALESLAVSFVAQNVTDNVVSPLVMQSAVKVHPILSLVGLIVGDALGGVLGMALAIPLTAALRAIFVYYFESHTGRQIVSEEGALFKSTAFKDDHGDPVPSADALADANFFASTLLETPKALLAYPVKTPNDNPTAAERLMRRFRSFFGSRRKRQQ
ncbi:MAG: AI-2E family transporter [Atopobiaceae bacterium]|jgi:predicted PurR-regulated permease PerM